MDALKAIETLAEWCEASETDGRNLSAAAQDEAAREYWRGFANAYQNVARQLRGLAYELKNPLPQPPWDSAGHQQSEQDDWTAGHPLASRDDVC